MAEHVTKSSVSRVSIDVVGIRMCDLNLLTNSSISKSQLFDQTFAQTATMVGLETDVSSNGQELQIMRLLPTVMEISSYVSMALQKKAKALASMAAGAKEI